MDAIIDLVKGLWKEKPHSFRLKNGLELLVKEDHRNPLCSIQYWVPTGSIHEEQLLGYGLSHFLEHMVFKGSSKYSGKEAVELLHHAGGSLNAYTSFNRTVYHVDLPAKALAQGLEILGDIVFRPNLDEDELERERQVVLREIDMTEDDPESKLSRVLFETAYRHHPYRYPVIGYSDLFKRIEQEDLVHYHARHYVPNRIKIVVAGDVDPEICKKLVEDDLGSLPRGPEALPVIQEEPPQLGPRDIQISGDYELTRGVFSFKIPGMAHADAPGLDALAHVLGHGYSSPLWQHLREGLCLAHSIEASIWNPGQTGLLSVSYTCDPQKHDALKNAIQSELPSILGNGFSEKRLEQCLRYLIVGEVNARKTVHGQASRIGFSHAIMGDPNYIPIYFEHLEELEPEDLVLLGERYLLEQGLTRASIEPEKTAAPVAKPVTPEYHFSYHETRLDNGLRVLRIPDRRLPKVHVSAVALGGPLYDPPGCEGAHYLLATLLTKDTKKRSAKDVSKSLESRAIRFDDFCGNNSFGLTGEALGLYQDKLFHSISEALLIPAFKPETVERERTDQIAQIRDLEDDSLSLTLRRLRQDFFKKHPYKVGPLGLEKSVSTLDSHIIEGCYKRLCIGTNTIVVVTGDYEDAQVDAFCHQLKQLPAGSMQPLQPPFQAPQEASTSHFSLQRQQSIFAQAYSSVGITDVDYYVSEVLEELFSGMSSQLFLKVREEQGLAYFVGAGRMSGLHTGMFYFYAGIEAAQANKVHEAIEAEIQRIREGKLLPQELESCKNRLLAKKMTSMQRIGDRGMHVALNALYGLPLDEGQAFAQGIQAVSTQDLSRFCAAHLHTPTTLSLVASA